MAPSTSAWTACRRRPRRGRLAGAGARYTSETSLFGDFAGFGTEAYAEAGAWAEGEGRIDVGPGQFGAGGGFDVGAGARAGVEQDVSLFGDNVTATGGVGVRTGVSASASGDFDFGIDRVGGEVDLGGVAWSRLRRQRRLRVLAEWAGK